MITKREGVCGGREIIEGHRIPVWQIAKLHKEGASIRELNSKFYRLSTEEIRQAIDFYKENTEKIEAQIEENEPNNVITPSTPNAHFLNGQD